MTGELATGTRDFAIPAGRHFTRDIRYGNIATNAVKLRHLRDIRGHRKDTRPHFCGGYPGRRQSAGLAAQLSMHDFHD